MSTVLLVAMGYRRSMRPRVQVLLLYCMSVLVLTVYSLSVYAAFAWFGQAELENATRKSGFFVSLTAFMLDLEVCTRLLCRRRTFSRATPAPLAW